MESTCCSDLAPLQVPPPAQQAEEVAIKMLMLMLLMLMLMILLYRHIDKQTLPFLITFDLCKV